MGGNPFLVLEYSGFRLTYKNQQFAGSSKSTLGRHFSKPENSLKQPPLFFSLVSRPNQAILVPNPLDFQLSIRFNHLTLDSTWYEHEIF